MTRSPSPDAPQDHAAGEAPTRLHRSSSRMRPWCRTCATRTTRWAILPGSKTLRSRRFITTARRRSDRRLYLRRHLPADRSPRPRAHRPDRVRLHTRRTAITATIPFVGNTANPNDLQALRNYIERYEYDAVGNFDSDAPYRRRRGLDPHL